MIGTRLGSYEVVAKLGQGGMGEVYRATDSNLKRAVAIKVLPAAVAADADRLARFQREAEVLASLNHPNIAAIYGLEKTPALTALVMELVEGEDLSALIARGVPRHSSTAGMPLADALPIARQIADALGAAHEQGIIHRDLKPANIKVRVDGTVKVLDFGLAKALGAPGSQDPGSRDNATNSPTLTARATQMGMILGTAAYMAPEQARGRAVDRRADVWAFGCVLYEMLTGTRAFPGDDITDVLAAVVRADPDWSLLPGDLSPTLQVFLRRCLEKDAKQRVGDIHDVRLALEGAFDTTAPPSPAVRPPEPARPFAWMAFGAIAMLAALLLAIPAARHLGETPPSETRVDIVTPPTTQSASFALSPDGRQIVYVASDEKVSRLWLRSLETTTAQPLAGTEGAVFPFWSADGRSVGFFAGGSLKRRDLDSSAAQSLAPVTNGSGGTWNADNVIVFAPSTTSPLMRIAAAGGAATAVTSVGPEQYGHYHPQFLPDGRRLLFRVGGSGDVSGIYLGGLDGTPPVRLSTDVSSAVYVPTGWLLWSRANALTAQRLDVERAALVGEPVTLADGVGTDAMGSRIPVSVAATGLVAYRASGRAERQLTWFDRAGVPRGTVGEPDSSTIQPRVSPDGRRVVVTRTVQGNQDLWLLDGARASRLTFDPGADRFPVWSPNSTRITYEALSKGSGDLYQKLTTGAGEEEKILGTDQLLVPTSWSKDGRFLMYNSLDPKTNADVWVLPMTGDAADRKPFVFLKTPFREAYGTFSPDGRWVAYHSNETGRPEVYVRPFVPPSRDPAADKSAGGTGAAATAAAGQWQVSTTGGILATWSADGTRVYYIDPDGAMMEAPISVKGATVEPGTPVRLFSTRIFGGGADIQLGRQYDVTADGRFLVNMLLTDAAAPITLLQHWNPAAKK